MVETEDTIGISFSDEFSDSLGLIVVEMHITDNQQITLELMVLLALKQTGSDKQQLEFFEFVELKHSDFIIGILIGA